VSVLVVGLSHKTAPVATLERACVSGEALAKLIRDVAQSEPVAETFVISTCNRVEVYAEVDRFHAAVTVICELLARHCAMPATDLTPYLYVHYEDRAVGHLLATAGGLDSMVVGEEQILGQVRAAIKLADELGTIGRSLRDLGRTALRAGKRVRAETGINQVGATVVSVALDLAAQQKPAIHGGNVLIVGAGSMSALATASAARTGAGRIVLANRTRARAERLAARTTATTTADVGVIGLDELTAALAAADLVISCTGASGHVITADMITPGRDLVIVDLAMPRDVQPEVAELPGVTLIGMDQLSANANVVAASDLASARAIIEEELARHQLAMHAASVAPIVVALRAKAAGVVDTELARLAGRLSSDGLTGHALDEIAQTLHRVVDKLLHAPTVRVKELAGSPAGEDYAAALRVLFDLDPRTVDAVSRADLDAGPEQEAQQC
jgi:glutamyl-tRNA reductase